MVEHVALLLIGRGYRIVRASEAGLSASPDGDVIEYALVDDLVVVTFDPDFRSKVRAGVASNSSIKKGMDRGDRGIAVHQIQHQAATRRPTISA
jgi:hypothetical protein